MGMSIRPLGAAGDLYPDVILAGKHPNPPQVGDNFGMGGFRVLWLLPQPAPLTSVSLKSSSTLPSLPASPACRSRRTYLIV